MKTKRRTVAALALVALAAFVTLGTFRVERRAHAQDQPPPVGDRISFGMVGITRNQTARLNVTNAGETHGITVNCRLVDSDGEVLHRRDGQPIERTMAIEPGHSAFLQMSPDNPPGHDEVRLNFRAVMYVVPPPTGDRLFPPGPIVLTLEVIENATGKTSLLDSRAIQDLMRRGS